MASELRSTFARIEALIGRDPGERNVAAFALPGQLEPAARSLLAGARVVLATGFLVLEDERAVPETDGPAGALALGRALTELGLEVRYATGPANAPLLAALGAEPLDVLDFVAGDPKAASYLAAHTPTHLVAIERPGRARDGAYRSMAGADLPGVSAIDELFLLAARRADLHTVGIGDGGNEVGLGTLADAVAAAVPHGERIASVVPADWPIVAGVSTWGAWGLVAALSHLAGRDLLPTREEVSEQLARLVGAGAVDGVTKRLEATLDGLPLETSLEVLEALRATA